MTATLKARVYVTLKPGVLDPQGQLRDAGIVHYSPLVNGYIRRYCRFQTVSA